MNLNEFKDLVKSKWLDRNSLVKTHINDVDSGNGILYTSIFYALIGSIITDEDRNEYIAKIKSCFKEPGLLMRNPTGSFGQEQWDDYLGVAVGCIFIKDGSLARSILWYGLRHGFFFNNDSELEWKDFLGRFVQVWPLMFAAAFPWLKWLIYLVPYCIAAFMRPPINDVSGLELQWIYHEALAKLYGVQLSGILHWMNECQKVYKMERFLSPQMATYYAPDHPFVTLIDSEGL